MDSKQIANLKNIAEEAKKPVVVHDLQDICKQKVLVNKITAEFLRTQIKLSESSKKLQEYSIQNAKEKLELTNQLITLFEEQCKVFDAFRQEECLELYKQLNELNAPPEEIVKLIGDLSTLDEKLKDLAIRIDYFERGVPAEQAGTQYKLKNKVQLDQTCGQQYSNPNLDDLLE
jgi:flagellar basal body P-ring protein FlgI